MVKFNLLPPLKNKSRQKGYGSITSLALANEDPESAVENADSYRIFCEAAKSSTACGALGWSLFGAKVAHRWFDQS
jgi:hypothetical protein